MRKICRRKTQLGLIVFLTAGIITLKQVIVLRTERINEELSESIVDRHANLSILQPAILPRGFDEKHLDLLVIVSSSPAGALKRNAIRSTWGKSDLPRHPDLTGLKWRTVFMTACWGIVEDDAKLMQESYEHGDLIIYNYKDSYREILNKLLGTFKWATSQKANFVLKTDDDIYISIPRLLLWLGNKGRYIEPLYAGKIYSGIVVRDKTHRHYVDPKILHYSYYPQFCKGAMFVLSWKLLSKMVKISRKVPRIPPDDAYIGLLAHELHVKPTRLHGIVLQSLLPYFYPFVDSCHYQSIIGFGDSLRPDQIVYLHQYLHSLPDNSSWPCYSRWLKMSVIIFLFIAVVYFFSRAFSIARHPYFSKES